MMTPHRSEIWTKMKKEPVALPDRLFGDDEESGVDEPKFDISLVGHTGKKTMLLRTMACV